MTDELTTRAMTAYFRSAKRGGYAPKQPDASLSGVEQYSGLDYVVLRNTNGPITVYRVRNDGMLKQLKRWPSELNDA